MFGQGVGDVLQHLSGLGHYLRRIVVVQQGIVPISQNIPQLLALNIAESQEE